MEPTAEESGIAALAQHRPEKPAIILGDAVRSYGELDRRVSRLAGALGGAGIGAGDRVVVALFNFFEWSEVLNALPRRACRSLPWRGGA